LLAAGRAPVRSLKENNMPRSTLDTPPGESKPPITGPAGTDSRPAHVHDALSRSDVEDEPAAPRDPRHDIVTPQGPDAAAPAAADAEAGRPREDRTHARRRRTLRSLRRRRNSKNT
jgi:hypothetical protein